MKLLTQLSVHQPSVSRMALAAIAVPVWLTLTACSPDNRYADSKPSDRNEKGVIVESAIANLDAKSGSDVKGVVTFQRDAAANGMRINYEIAGLTPGKHGFHIHENGDCSAQDGSSAGGHFNPDDEEHGAPNNPEHHAGDAGNIVANERGVASKEITAEGLSFSGADAILDTAVVVHAAPDDLQSQPSGNAGKRVACGVVRAMLKTGDTDQKHGNDSQHGGDNA